ncbi:hypothetical protein RHSIM_Rhsim12G0088900 [Rhododendron simsii]|uniref:Uncharacterized protein n=1 Tax=Rhododendron simsii TaxID=118357 RepID=A0A834G5N1_RHOSS|nr:hypothetical protein RHSIM_Rhsim12G0088900 [Rhododendron simsii]
MIMKFTMDKSIKQCAPNNENAKAYLTAVGTHFTKFDKAEKATYMRLLTSKDYDGSSGVREHIMKRTHYYNKLKDMKVELAEDFLVWTVLESLPTEFDGLKSAYNAQKGKWNLNGMTAIVTQEEARFNETKRAKFESAFVVTNDSGSHNNKNFKSEYNSNKSYPNRKHGKSTHQATPPSLVEPKTDGFKGKCHFCRVYGHKKVDCRKFKAWLENKGIQKQLEAK